MSQRPAHAPPLHSVNCPDLNLAVTTSLLSVLCKFGPFCRNP